MEMFVVQIPGVEFQGRDQNTVAVGLQYCRTTSIVFVMVEMVVGHQPMHGSLSDHTTLLSSCSSWQVCVHPKHPTHFRKQNSLLKGIAANMLHLSWDSRRSLTMEGSQL